MHVHQFHGVVAYGDAIGNDILNLRRMLRDLGCLSDIFAEFPQRNFESRARSYREYRKVSAPDTVLLCHFSIGYSADILAWLRSLPDRKVLIYHNITPHPFFAGINDVFHEATYAGRRQLGALQPLTVAGWGDSEFNRRELAERGWRNTSVLPIVFEPAMVDVKPDRAVLERYSGDGPNILFVSRIAPNKRVEDVILVFYHLKKFIEPHARLLLVGSTDHVGRYVAYLHTLIERLDLTDVIFTGHISRTELAAYYRLAHAYLCMSEHEGFGVPLVESMYFDVPVIGYAAAAVPETLGYAGVLVTRKEHAEIAELVALLASDTPLRARTIQRQRERWQEFTPGALASRLRACLETIG